MKAFLPLTAQSLPNYESDSFWTSIHKSAKEHGYKSAVVFALVRYKDFLLGIWSKTAPWNRMRIRMQRARGVQIGKNVHWGTDVTVDFPYPYFLVVEDGASLAGSDYILTHTKPTEYHSACTESQVAPVFIRKHAWVAVNVTILPGVEIGEGAIVSAGSVVSKSIPPMTIAKGNPAKVVADISELLRSNYSDEEFERMIQYRKEKYKI